MRVGFRLSGLCAASAGDMINDSWEMQWFGRLTVESYEDSYSLNPTSSDTDSDGLRDRTEIFMGFDANNADSDGDGTDDGDEDTDGDGFTNSHEQTFGTDLLDSNSFPGVTEIPPASWQHPLRAEIRCTGEWTGRPSTYDKQVMRTCTRANGDQICCMKYSQDFKRETVFDGFGVIESIPAVFRIKSYNLGHIDVTGDDTDPSFILSCPVHWPNNARFDAP